MLFHNFRRQLAIPSLTDSCSLNAVKFTMILQYTVMLPVGIIKLKSSSDIHINLAIYKWLLWP